MGSELEPEQVTPNTAGEEEIPEYDRNFPLTLQFRQSNMHGKVRSGGRNTSDEQTNPSESDTDDRT